MNSKPVRPERIGYVGKRAGFPGYAYVKGTVELGGRLPKASIPFAVEVWARHVSKGFATLFINRTPSASEVTAYFRKTVDLFGCGLSHAIKAPKGEYALEISVVAPYFPITNDGKSPDLSPIVDEIRDAVKKAINAARRAAPTSANERLSQKDVVLENLELAIDKASGDRQFRFSPRQAYYVLRPIVFNELGVELKYANFETILTEYESEHGDIKLMYRDPRGTLYHPHIGEDIALGTMAVEQYRRPDWTFNKVLYIEKEGFFEALKAVRWPEQNDCALLTSKGFSTRAVRDLLDLLGDGPEPVTMFCVHDADASGTMIYQTLQEETRARPRRKVEIVNLGLEPWEAIEMGLAVETLAERKRDASVAGYVVDRPDGDDWWHWLQSNRVELNEMATPAFVEWLDEKMLEHDDGKVIPPHDVVSSKVRSELAAHLRSQITARILREANAEEEIDAAIAATDVPAVDLDELSDWLEDNTDQLWTAWAIEKAQSVDPDGEE